MSEARMKLQAILDQRWAELTEAVRQHGLDAFGVMVDRAKQGTSLLKEEIDTLITFASVAAMEASIRAGDQITEEQAK